MLSRASDPIPAAHDRVYRTLRARIMHGEIDTGEALTLRGIGKEFGVPLTPAREAVRRLSIPLIKSPVSDLDTFVETLANVLKDIRS